MQFFADTGTGFRRIISSTEKLISYSFIFQSQSRVHSWTLQETNQLPVYFLRYSLSRYRTFLCTIS